jgi:hypothetical protein
MRINLSLKLWERERFKKPAHLRIRNDAKIQADGIFMKAASVTAL